MSTGLAPVPRPIGYPGGKSRLTKTILAHAPPHTTYVEPFAGGAAVFFAKEPAKVNVLADLDPQLVRFYKDFSCPEIQMCVVSSPPTLANRKKFTRRFREGSSDVCDYFMARRLSFNSNGKDVNLSHKVEGNVGKTVVARCGETEARLRKATILVEDFREVVRKYDGPKTFTYMDPPYVGRAKGLYKFEDVTPKDVCDLARKAKGKVLISHYDKPEVRKACAGLHMKSVGHQYVSRTRNHGGVHRVRELLISNYPLR